MKIELSDNKIDWVISPFANQLTIEDITEYLLRRGDKYFRIDGGEPQKVTSLHKDKIILELGQCSLCKTISLVSQTSDGEILCVACAYKK